MTQEQQLKLNIDTLTVLETAIRAIREIRQITDKFVEEVEPLIENMRRQLNP